MFSQSTSEDCLGDEVPDITDKPDLRKISLKGAYVTPITRHLTFQLHGKSFKKDFLS